MAIKKDDAIILVILGSLILAVVYVNFYGIPDFVGTIVSQCTQDEPTNITELKTEVGSVGEYVITDSPNCANTLSGVLYKTYHDRPVYKTTYQVEITTTTSSTSSTSDSSSTTAITTTTSIATTSTTAVTTTTTEITTTTTALTTSTTVPPP